MRFVSALSKALLLSLALAATAAQATLLFTTTGALSAADPIQNGRLSRNSIAQTWDNDEPFPGLINLLTPYHYHAYSINVNPFERYIQISIDSTAATTFFSAYQTSYDATNLALRWLGDAGTSGNFDFGGGLVDPRFFQVTAMLNSQIVVVVNESTTNGGLGLPFTLVVESFVDREFNDFVPRAVPEPSTLALLLSPLALVAFRRRRKAAA